MSFLLFSENFFSVPHALQYLVVFVYLIFSFFDLACEHNHFFVCFLFKRALPTSTNG